MKTLQHLIQFSNRLKGAYEVPYYSNIPEKRASELIKTVYKAEKTTLFNVDGVSDTPRMWTITYTLDGDNTSKSQYLLKLSSEMIGSDCSIELTDDQEYLMACNNLKKNFGVDL